MIKITQAWRKRRVNVNGKIFFPLKEVAQIDIETKKIDKSGPIDAPNSRFVVWGAYNYEDDKFKYGYDKERIQRILDNNRIIIGQNFKGFDKPVLERDLGLDFSKNLLIDLDEVMRSAPTKAEKESYKKQGKKPPTGKGRASIIGEATQKGIKDNRFPNFKLATLMKHGYYLFKDHPTYSQFFQDFKDEDFDYSLLDKDKWTEQERNTVIEYLRRDIVATKNFFEFLELYFSPLMEYLCDKDIKNLQYIHSSTGVYAYKAMCNLLNLPEEYDDGGSGGSFLGAYVFLPWREYFTPADGDGYCRDFTSQHPSHQHSMNLFTPAEQCPRVKRGEVDECPTAHSGDGEIFSLRGTYCACEQGPIEKLISDLLQKKIEYKKNNDPREFTVKILINSCYGISSSPIFKSIYNPTTGPDTTLMSRQSTHFMAEWMRNRGYIVTYGDTDSIYIMDPFRDKERMNRNVDEGVEKIKAVMPFSDDRYKMGIDAEFTHIFFFPENYNKKTSKFKKKNYIYITTDNEVKLNGLPLIKRSSPRLAKKIYKGYLEPEIKRKKDIKFDKGWIQQLIYFELQKDISILASKFNVNTANSYSSPTQLQAEVSRNYLQGLGGSIWLIKHKRKGFGIGKGKHYCTIDEAKQLNIGELDLENVWEALDPFIKRQEFRQQKQATLGSF